MTQILESPWAPLFVAVLGQRLGALSLCSKRWFAPLPWDCNLAKEGALGASLSPQSSLRVEPLKEKIEAWRFRQSAFLSLNSTRYAICC